MPLLEPEVTPREEEPSEDTPVFEFELLLPQPQDRPIPQKPQPDR